MKKNHILFLSNSHDSESFIHHQQVKDVFYMQNMMSYCIVVAKYKEDVSWLQHVKNYIVYDKSDAPIPGSIPSKNLGRESETFFRYIVEHYETLPEYVIFVQGNPFDHMVPISHESFQSHIENVLSIRPEKCTPLFPLRPWYIEDREYYRMNFSKYYKEFIGPNVPYYIEYSIGSQYIIPRDVIRRRSKNFYEKVHSMITDVSSEEAHGGCDKFTPWVVERLMMYIFNGPSTNDFMSEFTRK